MTDINDLRQRVEAAERAVGQLHHRDQDYSDRLVTLFGRIEQRLLDQRDQLRQRDQQIKTLEHQNRELRAMLHALLLAVEDGGRGRLGAAVGDLERRVSALVADERSAPPRSDGHAPASGPADAGEAPADTEPLRQPDWEPAAAVAAAAVEADVEETPDLTPDVVADPETGDGATAAPDAEDLDLAGIALSDDIALEEDDGTGAEDPAISEPVVDRDAEDDSVQRIIDRVSRLVSDLSEQDAEPPGHPDATKREDAPPTRAGGTG